MFGSVWMQRKLLFPIHLVPRPARLPHIPGLERWWIESAVGKVEAWFLPATDDGAARARPVVVFGHGNGELIDDWPDALAYYRRLGFGVILPEYRGYGRSEGTPGEAAIVSDLQALHARMARDPRIDMERLVYHGRSLGGGVVCALQRTHPARALVLESTFTSVADVARRMGVPSFLIYDKFESLPVVRAFQGPIVVFHGTEDTLIPVEHGRRLAASNPRAELVLHACGHNDLPRSHGAYWRHIESTLRTAGVLPE